MTDFNDKYISTSDKTLEPTSKKVVLSDDAFAIGEMLDMVRKELFRGNRHGR